MILTTHVPWDLRESKAHKKRRLRWLLLPEEHGGLSVWSNNRDVGWEAAFPSAINSAESAGVAVPGRLPIKLLPISCGFGFLQDLCQDEQAWGNQAPGNISWTLSWGGSFLWYPVVLFILPKSLCSCRIWKTQMNYLKLSFISKLEQRVKTKTLESKLCGLYAKLLRLQGLWSEMPFFPPGPSKIGWCILCFWWLL